MSPPTSAEMMNILASLLSARQGEDNDSLGAKYGAGKAAMRPSLVPLLKVLKDELKNEQTEFSFPVLSLAHEDHLTFNHENPSEAEKSAFDLLSRQVEFKVSTDNKAEVHAIDSKISEVSCVLLLNISESFALLVDSRLRAHANFLKKHNGIAFKKNLADQCGFELLDRKLQTLLALGNRISVAHVETKVELMDETLEEEWSPESSPISFQVDMKLVTESVNGATTSSSMTVKFEASGALVVSNNSSTNTTKIALEIDIKGLLSQMKLQATEVVRQVVETTNSLFVVAEDCPIARRKSYLALPHAPEEDQASGKNKVLVSPEVRGRVQDQDMPPLSLDNKGMQEDASESSDLSPDECADIVDGVFGDVDVTSFSFHHDANEIDHPAKKARLE